MSLPCAPIVADQGRPSRAFFAPPADSSAVIHSATALNVGGERGVPRGPYGAIDSKLPWYTVAIGTLWIKEVGCHSLLRVASIHARFGRTVRALRAKAGYSQESFADAIHIHRTSMGTLERGDGNPTLETIVKIARGLDVTLTELFLAMEKDTA